MTTPNNPFAIPTPATPAPELDAYGSPIKSESPELLPVDRLRNIAQWTGLNIESYNQDLPSTEAVFEAYHLTTVIYGVDILDEIHQFILDEHYYAAKDGITGPGCNPKPYIDFIEKHNLPWSKPDTEAAKQKGIRDRRN